MIEKSGSWNLIFQLVQTPDSRVMAVVPIGYKAVYHTVHTLSP